MSIFENAEKGSKRLIVLFEKLVLIGPKTASSLFDFT